MVRNIVKDINLLNKKAQPATKDDLENSKTNGEVKDRIAETGKTLDTDGDKTVTDISSIVPTVPQE